jgi:hypothetical protein
MSETRDDGAALRARQAQHRLYAAWEAGQEASRERSLSADLAWLSEAVELSRSLSPELYTVEAAIERGRQRARWLATMLIAEKPRS